MYNYQPFNQQQIGFDQSLFDQNIPFLPMYGARVNRKANDLNGKSKVDWHIGDELFTKLVNKHLVSKPFAENHPDLYQKSLIETALTNDIKNGNIIIIYVNDVREFGKSCTFNMLSTSASENKLSIPNLDIGYVDKFTFYGDSMLAHSMLVRYGQYQAVSTIEGTRPYNEFKSRIKAIKALVINNTDNPKVNNFDPRDMYQPEPGIVGGFKGNSEFNNFFDKMFDHPLFTDINSVISKDYLKEHLTESARKQLFFSKFSVTIPQNVGMSPHEDKFHFSLMTQHGPVEGFISGSKTNGYNLYETNYGLDYRFLKLTDGTHLEPGKVFVHFTNAFRPKPTDLKVIGNLFIRAIIMYAKTQGLAVDAGITVNGIKRLVTKANLTDDMSAISFNAGERKESINVSVTLNGKVYETKEPIQVLGEVRIPTEGYKFTVVPGYEQYGFDLTKI